MEFFQEPKTDAEHVLTVDTSIARAPVVAPVTDWNVEHSVEELNQRHQDGLQERRLYDHRHINRSSHGGQYLHPALAWRCVDEPSPGSSQKMFMNTVQCENLEDLHRQAIHELLDFVLGGRDVRHFHQFTPQLRHHGVQHQLEADPRVPPMPRLRPRLPERSRPSSAELRLAC